MKLRIAAWLAARRKRRIARVKARAAAAARNAIGELENEIKRLERVIDEKDQELRLADRAVTDMTLINEALRAQVKKNIAAFSAASAADEDERESTGHLRARGA